MRRVMGLPALLATIATAWATEPEFADSPALTSLWQATYSGNTDQLIDVLVQDHAFALQRSSDGRGPLFWAYEFKNVDAHALLTHLRADEEAEDLDGKRPAEFFPESEEMRQGERREMAVHVAPPTGVPRAQTLSRTPAPRWRSSPPCSKRRTRSSPLSSTARWCARPPRASVAPPPPLEASEANFSVHPSCK